MEPSPKSLILDLLSTLRRGSMPVGALVRAAALFGLQENALRVALARLRSAGQVERDERGRYRLGATSIALNRHVTGWRALESDLRRWNGSWVGVHTGAPCTAAGSPRSGRERRERALRFLGFRGLERTLQIRPDNRAGGVAGARVQLSELGLDPAFPVFSLGELDPVTETRARALWPTDALARGYRQSREKIEKSRACLPSLPRERAMVESFLLGGAVLRQLALDPLLPDALLGTASSERRALIAAMKEYDRAGRASWAGFLRDAGVAGLRAPAHVRNDRALEAVLGGGTA